MLEHRYQVGIQRIHPCGVWLAAFEHVEVSGGKTEVIRRLADRLTLVETIVMRDQRRHASGDPERQAAIGFWGQVVDVRFVEGKAGSAHPQRMHAGGPRGYTSQDIHDWTRQMARHGHLLLDGVKLLAVGEVAMPEEIGRFLKRDPASQFVDIVAADDQPPRLSINFAQLGGV